MHHSGVKPHQPRDQRCFGGPNGFLMFISTEDGGGGVQLGTGWGGHFRRGGGLSAED